MSVDQIRLPAGGGKVSVTGWVKSMVPVTRIELVVNGRIASRIDLAGGRSVKFSRELTVTESGWVGMAQSLPDWATASERDRVIYQFRDARRVYDRLEAEAVRMKEQADVIETPRLSPAAPCVR